MWGKEVTEIKWKQPWLTNHSPSICQRATRTQRTRQSTRQNVVTTKDHTQLRGHQLKAASSVASAQFFVHVWLQTAVLAWCIKAQEGCTSVPEGRMSRLLEETS